MEHSGRAKSAMDVVMATRTNMSDELDAPIGTNLRR
jgi:hypothetical protein